MACILDLVRCVCLTCVEKSDGICSLFYICICIFLGQPPICIQPGHTAYVDVLGPNTSGRDRFSLGAKLRVHGKGKYICTCGTIGHESVPVRLLASPQVRPMQRLMRTARSMKWLHPNQLHHRHFRHRNARKIADIVIKHHQNDMWKRRSFRLTQEALSVAPAPTNISQGDSISAGRAPRCSDACAPQG